MTRAAAETSDPLRLSGREGVVVLLALALVGFHIYTAGFGQFQPLVQRSVHVALGLLLTYLHFDGLKDRSTGPVSLFIRVFSGVAMLVAVVSSLYILFNEEAISDDLGVVAEFHDFVLGIALVLIILEGARRTTGPFLPLLAIAMILYALFGHLIPGSWGHAPFSPQYVLENIYLSELGIWGMVTSLSASLIAIFIIFGAFLLATGAAQSFMDLSIIVAGRSPGGAAKVATLSSAMFGTLNGAAVANVATTGNFTIPAMRRLGYRPEFAGAVEASASSGGQITPPIMGAGAFVMAEILSVPYLEIVYAAIIPALFFYVCIWFSIDVEARKIDLRPFKAADIPKVSSVLTWKKVGPLAVTIVVLLGSLFSGRTAELSAFYAICTNLVLFLVTGLVSGNPLKTLFGMILNGVRTAAHGIVTIVSLLICAQITLFLVSFTGIGIKLGEAVIGLGAHGGLLAAVSLALLVALILGMGMPTTAAYLVAAAVVVPALVDLGVPALPAHFFVFYGALLSALTPPLCTAVFTASVITKTHWWPIALNSMKLAAMKYILPFMFIFRPEVLLRGSALEIAWILLVGFAASVLFAIGFGGHYLTRIPVAMRIGILLVGLIFIYGSMIADVIGLAVLAALIVWQKSAARTASTG